MSPSVLSLLFNGTLALLLVITISYCSKLNKKIRQLQDGRSELAEMIARFDKSTERATLSVTELQTVSKKMTDALQLKIDKANFLADDLAFLIEKSGKLASQLDSLQKQRTEMFRPAAAPTSFNAQQTQAPEPPASKPASASKSGLEQLMAASSNQNAGPSVASIEAMLNKLAVSSAPSRSAPSIAKSDAPRTNAERELLNALKTGR